MNNGQEQQPHNNCIDAFIPSIINSLILKISYLFNHAIMLGLLIRVMFIALIQLGGYK